MNYFKFTRIYRFLNIFSKQPLIVVFLLSSSFFLSFVNGRLFRAKHMTKCILIKICINSFSISTKPLIFFYYSRVLRRLHVACTINVAFDAMQKLIIIEDINEIIISAGQLHVLSILSHL